MAGGRLEAEKLLERAERAPLRGWFRRQHLFALRRLRLGPADNGSEKS